MAVFVFDHAGTASRAVAERIRAAAASAIAERGRTVLGLATGSTPEKVYSNLVRMHADGEFAFRNVITYNLDEYYPIQPLDPKSYRSYMYRHLFGHVDLSPQRTHMLDGTVPEDFVEEHCAGFEHWLAADGGLDFQLLGIGRNGHIGFNEPCDLSVEECLGLRTRLTELHPVTRADAAREFGGERNVIPRALTMGVETILSARSILLLATGSHKAEAVKGALTGPMTARLPASLLQSVASKVTWMLDAQAASGLF
jgi:glucosamine-6-phosphate deaminase